MDKVFISILGLPLGPIIALTIMLMHMVNANRDCERLHDVPKCVIGPAPAAMES